MKTTNYGSNARRLATRIPILFALFAHGLSNAQVANYEFRSAMGSYQAIAGGTVLVSGTAWNNGVYTVPLSSSFFFNGSWYANMYVSCNGFITFGSAPAANNYSPISSTDTYAGAIASFGCNLRASAQPTSEVRWEQVGRQVVVQWQDVRRTIPTNEVFDLQVRLNLDNGVIHMVYGPIYGPGSSELGFPQVGLRGNDNTFPSNANNLLVSATSNWLHPEKGLSAATRCRFTAKTPAKKTIDGLTYTWVWSGGMELELGTDGGGSETSWAIVPDGGGAPVCMGNGYANNTTYILPCLTAPGSYRLQVKDSQGDGMCCSSGNGGYVLRNLWGATIIDNKEDGGFTSMSAIALPFKLPLGDVHVTDSTAAIEDKFTEHWVQATPDSLVRAEYGIGNQADDGYQWWFYNPDGGYTRRLLMSHASNNYQFWSGADRCTYLRLGHIVSSPLPLNVLLNVKVRPCVNGVYGDWGKASRLRIDLPDLCPAVQLIDDPGNPKHSCGITGVYLNASQWLHATFIPTAHKYKFQFTAPGYSRNITSNGSAVLMTTWAVNPLQYGPRTYNVKVSTSYDNGATWCPWGPVCTITTAAGPPGGRAMEQATAATADLTITPNILDEGPINISLIGLGQGESDAQLTLANMTGEVMLSRTAHVTDGGLNERFEIPSSLASGPYLVVVEACGRRYVRRVVVQ